MTERRLTAQRKELLCKNSRLAQEWHQRSEVVAHMERSLQERLNLYSSNQEQAGQEATKQHQQLVLQEMAALERQHSNLWHR